MIECLRFIPVNKHTCLGFADIKVSKWGLLINGISLHSKDGKKWVSLPAKQYEKDGEKKWMPYFKMENPDHQKELLKQIEIAVMKKKNEMDGESSRERANSLENSFSEDFINF